MKALELADKLDGCTNFYGESSLWYDHETSDAVSAAADELRRLAEVNAELLKVCRSAWAGYINLSSDMGQSPVKDQMLKHARELRDAVDKFSESAKAKEQQ